MEKQDIANVCDIQQQAFGERTPEDFEKCIKNSRLYCYCVVLQGQLIVGYSGVMFVGDECEFLTIAVDENYRNRGFGAALIKAMVGLAKKLNKKAMYLEVREDNYNAIELYKSMGFELSYIRKGYYPSITGRKDALVMRLEIK